MNQRQLAIVTAYNALIADGSSTDHAIGVLVIIGGGYEEIRAALKADPETVRDVPERLEAVAARLGIDLDTETSSTRRLDRLFNALGYDHRLVAGDGYCYFIDGGASGWYTSSVPVNRINHLTPRRWVEELVSLRKDAEQAGRL